MSRTVTVHSVDAIPAEWIGREIKIRRVQTMSGGRTHVTEPLGKLCQIITEHGDAVRLDRSEGIINGAITYCGVGPDTYSLDRDYFSEITISLA